MNNHHTVVTWLTICVSAIWAVSFAGRVIRPELSFPVIDGMATTIISAYFGFNATKKD